MTGPNEKHVLKAMAWDTMWYSLDINEKTGSTKQVREDAKRLKEMMDKGLSAAAATLSNPDTWRTGKNEGQGSDNAEPST